MKVYCTFVRDHGKMLTPITSTFETIYLVCNRKDYRKMGMIPIMLTEGLLVKLTLYRSRL